MSKEIAEQTDGIEIVGPETGPVFSQDEMNAIETIANGGSIDGLDVHKLDASIIAGIKAGMGKAEAALVDVTGYLGAALKLRTWTRVIDPATDNLFASEAAFTEWTLSKYPLLATVLRRELLTVIDGITDANGKVLSGAKLGGLLGISRQTVHDERKAREDGEDTGDARGPQTGGETVSDSKAVKRHITGFATAGTKVRDDAHLMDAEQLLSTIAEAKDTLTVALGTLRLNHRDVELPDWVTDWDRTFGEVEVADRKLRSGAQGTVATGPVLAGAPVDPANPAKPVAPKPKPAPRKQAG
jgi:hypothetical protein